VLHQARDCATLQPGSAPDVVDLVHEVLYVKRSPGVNGNFLVTLYPVHVASGCSAQFSRMTSKSCMYDPSRGFCIQ
jgi:hypothetical protein